MTRIDEATQSAVKKIMDSWTEWSNNAEMSATVQKDADVWHDEMHASLWRVVKGAVEEGVSIGQNP